MDEVAGEEAGPCWVFDFILRALGSHQRFSHERDDLFLNDVTSMGGMVWTGKSRTERLLQG